MTNEPDSYAVFDQRGIILGHITRCGLSRARRGCGWYCKLAKRGAKPLWHANKTAARAYFERLGGKTFKPEGIKA